MGALIAMASQRNRAPSPLVLSMARGPPGLPAPFLVAAAERHAPAKGKRTVAVRAMERTAIAATPNRVLLMVRGPPGVVALPLAVAVFKRVHARALRTAARHASVPAARPATLATALPWFRKIVGRPGRTARCPAAPVYNTAPACCRRDTAARRPLCKSANNPLAW